MNVLTVDVAVIGAGSAGLTAYRAARALGQRTLLIEGGPYGTTCARVGCMPSKLLIAAAEAAHAIKVAPAFGVHAGVAQIDGREVMARLKSERNRFVEFVVDGVEQMPQADRLRGHARFISPTELQVDQHTIVNAGRIVIAVGSSPRALPELQHIGERLLVTDDVFEWNDLPESVAVIGTGAIGLEIGQALARLGVRVALFGRSNSLAQLSDPAVLASATGVLGSELDLRQHSRILGADVDGDGVMLKSRAADGTERSEHYTYVLAAVGRVPNMKELDLEHAGLEISEAGVPVHDPLTMQCGSSAIFIAGDAGDDRPLLHEAADQGRIAGSNAARYPQVQPGLRRAALAIVFTDPQIATVGQPFGALQPGRFVVGEVDFESQGRSRVMLQNKGVLRVYAEQGSGKFIGAEMVGPRAEHLAHLLAWACQNEMTLSEMLDMPFYHPVIEEGVRTALRSARERLLHGLPPIEHCTDCTPGV